MKLLFRLLRKNVNVWQLVGFAVANLVGAVIVLFGVQAYEDASQVVKSPDSLLGNDFVVLSKPVSSLSTFAGVLGLDNKSFGEAELSEIEQAPGVVQMAPFRTANFPVYGALTLSGFEVSTEMFLESVPDAFLDVEQKDWSASVDGGVVPVIVPRAYLNFYNYGFATARSMPQIGEELFSLVPLRLIVRGAGQRVTYDGQVVGFTDRLNTILVPDDFLKAANERYAPGEVEKVSRVIVETDGNNVDELMAFIEDSGYVVDGGEDDSMKMLSVVRTVISVVVALGLLVSSLSFFLLLISILLLIEKNRYKNDTLHQLGYPDSKIALPYQTMAVTVDVLVWFVACMVTYAVYPVVSRLMAMISPGFEPAGPGLLVLASLALCLVFSLIHIWLIRSKIRH